jgi:hemerythrin-like domain-containing protein
VEALKGDSLKMGVQIGAKPDSGFDDPIGMLRDCHRRIEHFLRSLCVVVERARGRSLSAEEAAAVEGALRYFRSGGQRHTADEEESLFPRMREDAVLAKLPELEELENEHREANALHQTVDKLYSTWIKGGQLPNENEMLLRAATQRLQVLYTEHIEMEEKVVFPLATQVLDGKTIAVIGEEFRARRV